DGIDDQHPAPRTEQEAKASPPPAQLRPQAWEPSERDEDAFHASLRVFRERVRSDHPLEVRDCRRGQLDPSQGLELVQIDRSAPSRLFQPKLGPFERARYPIQQCGDVPRICARLIQSLRKE